MGYDALFDTTENRSLLAICARKLIRNTGIGGVIWGLINLVIGIIAIQMSPVNIGIIILAVMMLGTGVQALTRPSIRILLTETIVTILLLAWNVGVSIINFRDVGVFDPRGLIFPLIIVVLFFRYYRNLQHVKEQVASVKPEELKATKAMCKALVKKKLKKEPAVVQSSNRKCRIQLMDGKAFFIQRDLMRAFVAPKDAVRAAIVKPDAKRLKTAFEHPLGRLKYDFDRKNSDKLRGWLSGEVETALSGEGADGEPVAAG